MTARQLMTMLALGVLSYAALVLCMLAFWATTAALFGQALP